MGEEIMPLFTHADKARTYVVRLNNHYSCFDNSLSMELADAHRSTKKEAMDSFWGRRHGKVVSVATVIAEKMNGG